jgi:serine/threonine protein kinase
MKLAEMTLPELIKEKINNHLVEECKKAEYFVHLANDLIQGLYFLVYKQKGNVINHLDIKPDNIVYYNKKYILCDFGLSNVIY